MMKSVHVLLVALTAVSSMPIHYHHHHRRGQQAGGDGDVQPLVLGNTKFRSNMAIANPGLMEKLAKDGQAPPFLFLGCSDSRVNEATIFGSSTPGTLFTERNIANQFLPDDLNTNAVVSYGVSALGVQHILIMGHYGCGGVQAAIAAPPTAPDDVAASVQKWIDPIRKIYANSTRPEIVTLRTRTKTADEQAKGPELHDPGFRALVEENVKAGVLQAAQSSVVQKQFAALSAAATGNKARGGSGNTQLKDLFIHGLVFDIETGEITDLGVSVGPPGKTVEKIPFSHVSIGEKSQKLATGPKTSSVQ